MRGEPGGFEMNEQKIKVMIVDDEANTRNLLRICLDWAAIGCEIAWEAESGQEALDLLMGWSCPAGWLRSIRILRSLC